MPAPETLLEIRTHVADFHNEFETLLKGRAVKRLLGELQGEQLSRVPKGFRADHPAADLLRRKQFLLYTELEPQIATTPDVYEAVVSRFKAMTPFMEFLNAPLAAKGRKMDPRELLG